ncbi:MAG: outer membrane beta-barrel protein [Verrucomicrobiales bacterium]
MHYSFKTGLLTLAGFALGASNSHALEASDVLLFSKGPVTLRPHLEVSETFNDNIYYLDRNKESDFISVISPGLDFQFGRTDLNYFNLKYRFEHSIYADNSELDADQHRFALGSHFEQPRWSITGEDRIEFLSNVLGGGISLRGQKVDRTVFYDNYQFYYNASERTGVYLEGLHSTTDFDEDVPLLDSNTLMGTAGFEYKAFSRTGFFGEIYYGQTATDPNVGTIKPPHASFIGGFLGVRGNFTEKLSGSAKAGYESRSFSDNTPGGDLPVVQISLTEKFTDRNSLSLTYQRKQEVSVQFERAAYTSDTVALGYMQQLDNVGKLKGNVSVSYGMHDYDPTSYFNERTDHLVGAGINLTYAFRIWLNANLGYNYELLRSNIPAILDYDVNRVSLGISIGY